MWSSISVTISLAVAICQRDPGVSCVRGLGHSLTTHPLSHPSVHPPTSHPHWAGESPYLYPAHPSFPVDPCG